MPYSNMTAGGLSTVIIVLILGILLVITGIILRVKKQKNGSVVLFIMAGFLFVGGLITLITTVISNPQGSMNAEYQFYKADSDKLPEGTSQIIGVYDSEYDAISGSYIVRYDATYQSLFIGQCLTLFGKPDYVTDNNEDLFSYVIAAEDGEGNVIYLEVYYGPSGPAIGGIAGDEAYERAAEALAKNIMDAKATDYEIVSEHEDVGMTIKMGVKDGQAYYDTQWDNTTFPEGEIW
ncbi:MAG: hypothetical protein IJ079_05890 [Lachnospiraceae bacterium]|nr:hypothetical protein [Lachnospiraceae bacterium]MBR1567735.1 hypothetical protein [Lachnospiraceae bacterium]